MASAAGEAFEWRTHTPDPSSGVVTTAVLAFPGEWGGLSPFARTWLCDETHQPSGEEGGTPMATPVENGIHGVEPEVDTASFRVEEVRGCGVVHAVGEIDLNGSGGLWEAVSGAAALSSRVIVDLTSVQLIDSTGLSVLVEAQSQARASGAVVALAGPGRLVRTVLEITGLYHAFPIYGELEDAVAALASVHIPRSWSWRLQPTSPNQA